jgi:Ca2+-binding RTX toxin-like protein
MRTWSALAALSLLLLSASARAQNASCPTSNRLVFSYSNGQTLNVNDGASYVFVVGEMNRNGSPEPSTRVIHAFVYRNGTCLNGGYSGAFMVTRNGTTQNALTVDSNICLGGGTDMLDILGSERVLSCNSSSFRLYPVDYNGYRLSIYGGGGPDYIVGGNGNDSLYGGPGEDSLEGGGGSSNRLYGEDSNDTIDAQCRPTTITCGNGTSDTVRRAATSRPSGTNCETWSQQGC